MTCLGVLERGKRDKGNETGLKGERVIEMSIYSAFHTRDARSLSLCNYLPSIVPKTFTVLPGRRKTKVGTSVTGYMSTTSGTCSTSILTKEH